MQQLLFGGLWTITQVFLLWLGADFITGIVHWWQDTYGNPTWPILGKYVIAPNLRHHDDPRGMLKVSYWARMNTSLFAAGGIIGLLILCDISSWQAIVLIVFASQGNEIHAMGHRTNKENGLLVVWLQTIGIIQTRKTHGWHHKAPYDTNFFVMTEYLNPFFNKIKFFERLERLIQTVFRIKPLRGTSIRDGF